MEFIDTGINSLNSILCDPFMNKVGGIPIGYPSAIFGEPEMGKTWFTIQLACSSINSDRGKKKAIIINTELKSLESIIFRLASRFSIDPNDIICIKVPSIEEFGKLFGYNISLNMNENGGKINPNMYMDGFNNNSLEKKYNLKEVGFIGIDSFTALFERNITSKGSNYPVRATITHQLFNSFYTLATSYNLSVFMTCHSTGNINLSVTKKDETPIGADPLLYNTDFLLHIRRPKKKTKNSENIKYIERRRFPGLKNNESGVDVKLKENYGFVDL